MTDSAKYPVLQGLMDKAFENSRENETKEEFFKSRPDPEFFALCVGTLNYQVENGGFMQWYDNGYAMDEVVDYLLRVLPYVGPKSKEVAEMVSTFMKVADSLEVDDEDFYSEFYEESDNLSSAFYKINKEFLQECEEHAKKEYGE